MNTGYDGQDDCTSSFFKSLNSTAVKFMVSIALLLIIMGILVLLFPLVLAFFVALFFFTIAAIILYITGRLFWHDYMIRREMHTHRNNFPDV